MEPFTPQVGAGDAAKRSRATGCMHLLAAFGIAD